MRKFRRLPNSNVITTVFLCAATPKGIGSNVALKAPACKIKPLQFFPLVISKAQRRSMCVLFCATEWNTEDCGSVKWPLNRATSSGLTKVSSTFHPWIFIPLHVRVLLINAHSTPTVVDIIPTSRINMLWNKAIIGSNQRRHLIIHQTGDAEGMNPSVGERQMEHWPHLSATHYWKQERKRRETSKERSQKDRRAFIFMFKGLTLMIKALWPLKHRELHNLDTDSHPRRTLSSWFTRGIRTQARTSD